MRIALRILSAVMALAVLAGGACLGWFYFYSRDIPNFRTVASFAPDSTAIVSDYCSGTPVQAIPATSIGTNLQNAVRAAEGENDDAIALRVSRQLFCDSRTWMLKRELLEYKAAVQLRSRFTYAQLVTIYLNKAYFGDGLVGAESASLHYYGRHTSELDIAQAALIAGLLRAPNYYLPEHHPDRAKERRDAVIQAMLKSGTITAEQAEAAEQSTLR
jgi:membrane carboxypeptidase/penicillin-binding protein